MEGCVCTWAMTICNCRVSIHQSTTSCKEIGWNYCHIKPSSCTSLQSHHCGASFMPCVNFTNKRAPGHHNTHQVIAQPPLFCYVVISDASHVVVWSTPGLGEDIGFVHLHITLLLFQLLRYMTGCMCYRQVSYHGGSLLEASNSTSHPLAKESASTRLPRTSRYLSIHANLETCCTAGHHVCWGVLLGSFLEMFRSDCEVLLTSDCGFWLWLTM